MSEQVENTAGEQSPASPPPWEQAKQMASAYAQEVGITEQATTDMNADPNTPWGKAQAASKYTPQYDLSSLANYKDSQSAFNMDAYLQKLKKQESAGGKIKATDKSSAQGSYQFIAGTWNSMVNKLGLDYTLSDRNDDNKATIVVKAFTEENRKQATKDLGREPSMMETYMYHMLGSAKRFLTAPDTGAAKDYVKPDQARANASVFFRKNGVARTVGEVKSIFERKFR